MSGNVLKAARKDIAKITQKGGFEETMIFSDPSSNLSAEIKGLHSKHWQAFETEGSVVNSKNAHISVMESVLLEAGFKTRNEKTGNVKLDHLIIEVPDSTETPKKYTILESFPSETTGLIVCILGDYKTY